MNTIFSIRKELNVTQAQLAEALGVSQGNVSHYEKGQKIPPVVAARLINFAMTKSIKLSFDDIYCQFKKNVSKD